MNTEVDLIQYLQNQIKLPFYLSLIDELPMEPELKERVKEEIRISAKTGIVKSEIIREIEKAKKIYLKEQSNMNCKKEN